MKVLYLVRHDVAWGGSDPPLLGRTDTPMRAEGAEQIARLVPLLASGPPDAIYSSPLRRARQSAAIIASHFDLESRPAAALREIDFGDWEGRTLAELRAAHPHELERWLANPAAFAPPNAESVASLCGRVSDFLSELLRQNETWETCRLVTHGGPIRAALDPCAQHARGELPAPQNPPRIPLALGV
jgi:broad specificity phosphatase PhoE